MPLPPDKFVTARIVRRVDFSGDLFSIGVDPGCPFEFTPGQYATLGLQTSQGLIERPYSIVSAPQEREVEFFVELVPHGRLTPLLHLLGVGDRVCMRRIPKGRFTLDAPDARTKRLLICTVTGIAPFVSYARTLRHQWNAGAFSGEEQLFLLHGASHAFEFGYAAEMRALADEVPWLTYVPTISRSWEHPEWSGETGRVEDVIRKYSDRWGLDGTNSTVHLCGHPGMIAQGRAILHRSGWASTAIKQEAFFTIATRTDL
jgi:ferredoxin--NADP+ reductase